jgi:transposase
MLRAEPTITHVEARRSKADPQEGGDSGHVQPPRRYRRHRHRRPLQPSLPAGHRQSGEVIEEGRILTNHSAFEKRFSGSKPMCIAIETGTHSPWISRMLEEYGHEILVANARKVRLIYGEGRKNDKIDAEKLARLARLDPKLLAPVKHRGETSQTHLALLRSRDALVSARTKLVNHLRGTLKSFGARLPECTAERASTTGSQNICPKIWRQPWERSWRPSRP